MPYSARREKLLATIKASGIDVGLVTSPTNVQYLTGFACEPHERFLALALDARDGSAKLYLPLLDEPAAEAVDSELTRIAISDTDDAYKLLADHTAPGAASIGVEKGTLTLAVAERIQAALPSSGSLSDLEPLLLPMRLCKSDDEIKKIRHAVEIVEQVVACAVDFVKEGMTELELTAEIERQMRVLGADRPAFESIVLTGPRTALPHGRPGATPIRTGDFVLIDIGVQVDGYCSDITRTFVMGEPSEAQVRIYETVLAANEAGIRAASAGVPVSAVDRAARDVIEQAGYGPLFSHRVGHGFGMEVHEQPSMSGVNSTTLEPGYVFTVEPGIYDPIVGGVRIEDDIYIREDGSAGVITSYPKHLIRLGKVNP